MPDNQGYEFTVLDEAAAEADLFPDKTHQAVANILHKLICSANKAHTIGLEGSWGTGKSTVIRLLKEKFQSESIFFVFDAWAHEGDPLRRIFLESFINHVDPKQTDAYLQKILLEISNRKKTVTTESHTQTSELAKWLTLSAFFVPIGVALLSAINYEKVITPFTEVALRGSFHLPLIFGLILSAAPFIALGLWWKWGETDARGKPLLNLIDTNSKESYSQDITEDNEQTSIEFERSFRKILDHIFTSADFPHPDRIVIIIDNLDRIDSHRSLNVWSTLQTYFQHRSKAVSFSWIEKLWFIVPYDRDALKGIWSANIGGRSKSEALANSFFDKSFQVRAEVPEPVFSGWTSFLKHSAKNALGAWPPHEVDVVITTFSKIKSQLDKSPTPREIYNLINQVGLLGLRWGAVMSAESITLYAALRQNISDRQLRNLLLSEKLFEKYDPTSDPQTLKMELAGLLFGVRKEKGLELLLGPQIKTSLQQGKGEVLEKLVLDYKEAFWIVWRGIRNEIMPSDTHNDEYKIAFTRAMHDGLIEFKTEIKSEIRQLIRLWQTTDYQRTFERLNYVETYKFLTDFEEDPKDFSSWLSKTVSERLNTNVTLFGTDATPNLHEIKQISELAEYLEESSFGLKNLRYTPLGISEWVKWVNFVTVNQLTFDSVYPKNDVISGLADSYLGAPTISNDVLKIFNYTLKLDPTSQEWSKVCSKFESWCSLANRELENDEAYELILDIYTYAEQGNDSLQKGLANPTFWNRATNEDILNAKFLPVLTAVVLGEKVQQLNFISSSIKAFWSSQQPDSIRDFIFHELDSRTQLGTLWELAKDSENNLAIQLIKSNATYPGLYLEEAALLNLGEYGDWIDEIIETVVAGFSDQDLITNIMEDLSNNSLSYDKTLFLINEHGDRKSKRITKKIIQSISKETWGEHFEEDSWILNCVHDETLTFNHKYREAFESYFKNQLKSDSASDWIWENFAALANKTIDQELLFGSITLAYFTDSSDNLTDEGFNALGPYFVKSLKSVDSDLMMRRLCHWIDSTRSERLEWLLQSPYKFTGEPLEGLSSRVIEISTSDEAEEWKSLIARLGKKFNIPDL